MRTPFYSLNTLAAVTLTASAKITVQMAAAIAVAAIKIEAIATAAIMLLFGTLSLLTGLLVVLLVIIIHTNVLLPRSCQMNSCVYYTLNKKFCQVFFTRRM